MSSPPSAGADLLWVIERATERAADLLDPAETVVLQRLRDLSPDLRTAYARRVRRVNEVQHADDEAVAGLIAADLATEEVPWSARAAVATVPMLKDGARRLGLPTTGRRAVLVERMAAHTDWTDARFIRVRHRRLIRRLDRFAFLHRWPDPARPVVQRLGHVVFPEYEVGDCPPLFASRAALLAWETVADTLEAAHEGAPVDVEVLLDALSDGTTRAPGALDLTRSAAKGVVAIARERERRGDTAVARELYERVLPHVRSPVPVVLRIARTLEAEDRHGDAWARLHAHRGAQGPDAMGVHRAGRRLGKRSRRGWAPPPPSSPPSTRTVPLPIVAQGRRPLFGSGMPVEPATIELLAGLGRRALHAEGGLWRHLYGLCLAPDAYFHPVGQLPAHYLSGPVDVGRPGFADRRREVIDDVLAQVRSGRAADLVRRTHARFPGRRVAGITWRPLPDDLALVHGVGPSLLARVLETLLERGWRASAGAPDLLILPGPEVRLPGAMPRRLPGTLSLAELKTPTDTLSDAQRWWIQRLEPVVPVEVWNIRPVADAVELT